MLHGSVLIHSDDAWGARSIIGRAGPGQVFAEAYACTSGVRLGVSVSAAQECEIMFLQARRLLCAPGRGEERLIANLLRMTARRNLALSQKITFTTPKTIRARLTAYLSYLAAQSGSRRVRCPFDRQELADYLGVERRALSNEISKMRREGLIDTEKRVFILHGSVEQ